MAHKKALGIPPGSELDTKFYYEDSGVRMRQIQKAHIGAIIISVVKYLVRTFRIDRLITKIRG